MSLLNSRDILCIMSDMFGVLRAVDPAVKYCVNECTSSCLTVASQDNHSINNNLLFRLR